MTGKSSKTEPLSLRVPTVLMAHITAYAEVNGLTKSQAAVHYLRAGVRAEREQVATREDIAQLKTALTADITAAMPTRADLDRLQESIARAIAEQPIAVAQGLPEIKSETDAADLDAWKQKPLLDRIFKR